MRVALLFIDGVGIGLRDPSRNPLARASLLLSHFADGSGTALPQGGEVLRLDATFDVEGRPQSASNQTAIFTGTPAPRLIGRHLLGYPHRALRELLAERSIVKRLVEGGRRATFANGYPAAYLDALGLERRPSSGPEVILPERVIRRLRPSASTLAMAAARVPLRTLADVRQDLALTHDLDGRRARGRGVDVPERTAVEAAEVFLSLVRENDFTLFEHYLADEAGHARDFEAAGEALGTFDAFAREVVASRPSDTIVLICSDHGNVEDLSLRSHTRNEVPCLTFGAPDLQLSTVADVGSAVLRLLGVAD